MMVSAYQQALLNIFQNPLSSKPASSGEDNSLYAALSNLDPSTSALYLQQMTQLAQNPAYFQQITQMAQLAQMSQMAQLAQNPSNAAYLQQMAQMMQNPAYAQQMSQMSQMKIK